MDREEQIAHLRLIRTPNIGPMTFSLLLQRYGSAADALRAVPELAKRGGRTLQPAPRSVAEAELAANEAVGARLLFKGGDGYPQRLTRFDDAPAVLSTRGAIHLLDRPGVGIVGARNASINAQRLAQGLADELASEGHVVISGLARGIDAAAHNGALAGGTLAVIAGGIDVYYPPENTELQDAIAETGLIVAEMPPGTQPTPRHFPIRNRIIGSLTLGTVLVEAAERSGSLITARETAERGGEVMAVPGSPLDPRSAGCNHLIREGATLVRGMADILECLARPSVADAPDPQDWRDARLAPGPPESIDRCRTTILEALGPEGTDIDEVIRWCGAPTATVLAAILELELAGRITRHHGNRVCLVLGT
ncbi:MAG: DNA-processing protein DprA [Pseudomonadota bacterium]|nr:DNA-processing protein DprA [Pseudomonadota bacterium]